MRSLFASAVLFFYATLFLSLVAVAHGDPKKFVLENRDLQVVVEPSGSVSVLDKASGFLWHQRPDSTHSDFKNVAHLPGPAIRFDTAFHSGCELPAHVKLLLHDRQLTFQTSMDDTNTPIPSFDFIAPFQPATNMSLVVPDFCDGHIFPCNLASWPLYNLDSIKALNLTLPWVAVVDLNNGTGYSLTFDTPYDAQLKLAPVGGLRSPSVAWNPEMGRFGYTRAITYNFTAHGGYVALAKAYREQARADGLLVTLEEKAKSRPAIAKLYGAVALWDFDDLLPDETLRARGVAHAIHHVERWDGGSANREKLGLANRLGFITEEYDYYLAGPVDGHEQRYQDYHISAEECVRDASGDIVRGERNWGMRCPQFYLPTAETILPDRLKAFPQTSRYFDQITQNFDGHDNGPRGGGSTEECWESKHPETRSDWVRDVDDFYRYAAQSLGLITGAELGKFHQVPFTEIFYGMESCYWPWPDVVFPDQRGPNTNTWNIYEQWAINPADRVPLWELVFHDCAVATLYPWDGNDVCYKIGETNQDLKDCLNVLYGTPATFMVGGSGESQYFHNPHRWLQSYRNTCKVLEVLADKEMVCHRFLTPDHLVQETDWSDGTRITVNFGANDYFVRKGFIARTCLKQFCFTVWGPWGEATRACDPHTGRIITQITTPTYHFDDRQLENGSPVSLGCWLTAPHRIQVNVDEIAGATNVCFIISPRQVQKNWNVSATHVYSCDPKDGKPLREIPWKRIGKNGIQLSGLSGWLTLEVASEPACVP